MSLKQLFLAAPDGQLDASIKPTIQAWDDEPTALQILKTLDMVVHCGAGSGFVVVALENMLEQAMVRESTNLAELVKLASWRNLEMEDKT